MKQSLILTLQMDDMAQGFYEDLRRRYFPPERNLIPAHLTLFHDLPDEEATEQRIRVAAGVHSPFPVKDPSPRSLGRGVAVFLQSETLIALHASLALAFQEYLIPQDRQRFWPHIVVQNKVDPEIARQTLPLVRAIALVEPIAVGLVLWRYLDGPWELVGQYPFGESASAGSMAR